MKETRCKNSGALLFHTEPQDLETIKLKEENKNLKTRLDKIELMLNDIIKDKHV